MLPRSITLHIGLQKTGTTLIQRTLRKMRNHLASQGVVYVGRQDVNKLPALIGWRAFPLEPVVERGIGKVRNRPRLHDPRRESEFTQELRDLAAARCREVLDATGRSPKSLLMSNETLVGRLAPDFGAVFRPRAESAIEHVLEAFEPEHTTLILYVRRQDSLLESQYMQKIHAGEVIPFNKWAKASLRRPYIRFSELADRLQSIPTVDSLVVRPFETIKAGPDRFMAELLGRVGVRGGLDKMDFAASNPSYTAPALEAALAINGFLEKKEQVRATRKFLKKLFPRGEYPPPELFSAAERREVLEMYEHDNRELFRKHIPEAAEDAYLSDAGTDALKRLAE